MSSPPVDQSQATAQIGGIPNTSVDVPICAVFIALFVGLAATHMTILQINQRRKHKFLFNGMLFGFAMSRIMACAFRIAWAKNPTNADVSLVAAVFLNAVLVYLINLLFAWRMVRSAMPSFGWNPVVRRLNKIMLWAILGMLIPLIVVIILRVKNPALAGIGTATTVISRLAQTYFLLLCVEAAILLAVAAARAHSEKDEFGHGPWHHKVVILAVSITLATIEAGFRCGTAWTPTPLAIDPAWWDSKAAFYCFNFMLDVLILGVLAAGRVDRRFHVPNKANGAGSYARGAAVGREGGSEVGKGEASEATP